MDKIKNRVPLRNIYAFMVGVLMLFIISDLYASKPPVTTQTHYKCDVVECNATIDIMGKDNRYVTVESPLYGINIKWRAQLCGACYRELVEKWKENRGHND